MNEKMSDTQNLQNVIKEKCGSKVSKTEISLGDLIIWSTPEDIFDLCAHLKSESDLDFNFLVDITAVDWLDDKEQRFEVVYHFLSHTHGHRVRIKVPVDEKSASVSTITSLWNAANFLEREVWDMYGVRFEGHPDLRRILMYDEFEGHPLRKDFPVQGKQPRVPMLHPEVENTAMDMQRAALVQINKRK